MDMSSPSMRVVVRGTGPLGQVSWKASRLCTLPTHIHAHPTHAPNHTHTYPQLRTHIRTPAQFTATVSGVEMRGRVRVLPIPEQRMLLWAFIKVCASVCVRACVRMCVCALVCMRSKQQPSTACAAAPACAPRTAAARHAGDGAGAAQPTLTPATDVLTLLRVRCPCSRPTCR